MEVKESQQGPVQPLWTAKMIISGEDNGWSGGEDKGEPVDRKISPSNVETCSILEFSFSLDSKEKSSCNLSDDDSHFSELLGNEDKSFDNEDVEGGVIAINFYNLDDEDS